MISDPDRDPTSLSLVTLNVLHDLATWDARASLIVAGLRALAADVIALQEVDLRSDAAPWLAEALGGYSAFVTSGTGRRRGSEGLALLSRLPTSRHEALAFGAQGRVAQRCVVAAGDTDWTVANVHLHFSVFDGRTRRSQARRLLEWLPQADQPTIVCGDFNARPGARTIALMRQRFVSAQSAVHGTDRLHTFPTGLHRGSSPRHRARAWMLRAAGVLLARPGGTWSGTLDYVFVDPRVRVRECRLALHQPHPDNPRLYPSDHMALAAQLEWPAR